MQLDLTITFSADEIKAMVLERCKTIKTVLPGTFKVKGARYNSIPDIEAEFVPDEEEVPEGVVPPCPCEAHGWDPSVSPITPAV